MVKQLYKSLADQSGLKWVGRDNKTTFKDPVNQAISGANASLYGLTEAVILALGYSPAIGFVHSGNSRSFVFDVADCVKFSTVVPLAMRVAKESETDVEGRVRRSCRDMFSTVNMAQMLVDVVEHLMEDGNVVRS